MVWPEPVERIAAYVRAAGASGTLEQLSPDADGPPGLEVHAHAFECEGRLVVALVGGERTVDRDKVARRAGCVALRPAAAPPFPFQGARVLVDRTLFVAPESVWLEAGAPRFVLGLMAGDLARLTRAESADLALEA